MKKLLILGVLLIGVGCSESKEDKEFKRTHRYVADPPILIMTPVSTGDGSFTLIPTWVPQGHWEEKERSKNE
jgi:hypothetical protein